MPLGDILKRQVGNLFKTEAEQGPSLEQELRTEFDRSLTNAIDPGREAREAAREAANLERTRTQAGLGQGVEIDGIPGRWEAVELFYFDETSASFTLVDRLSGDTAQLSAVDDGTVILDSPGDQHGATVPGAFWRNGQRTGIRLAGAILTSDGVRRITLTCDLSAPTPDDDPADEPEFAS